MTIHRCANAGCQRSTEPPVCECGHASEEHQSIRCRHCQRACVGKWSCDCSGYVPQPTLCADCQRAAKIEAAYEMAKDDEYSNWKDEAAYDEHFGISVDDRGRR